MSGSVMEGFRFRDVSGDGATVSWSGNVTAEARLFHCVSCFVRSKLAS